MRARLLPLPVLALLVAPLAGGPRSATALWAQAPAAERIQRPIPAPVVPPPPFRAAVERETRSTDGRPGPDYWTQWTTYDIEAELDPATGLLTGSELIRYRNRSPDTLAVLGLNLYQNLHAPGVVRSEAQEITGGVSLERVRVDGWDLSRGPSRTGGYQVSGTIMSVRPPEPVPPGGTVEIEIDWSFTVPQSGAGRMGWSASDGGTDRDVYFVSYWFPRMGVYDDLRGWDLEPYRGIAEFYDGFGDYRVSLTVPAGWTVMATGELENPDDVYAPRVLERLETASGSDSMVVVVGEGDREAGTVTAAGSGEGTLTYTFRADSIRDFAWTASDVQRWTATSARVPDRDGDGAGDRVLIHSFWRPDRAPLWEEQALYGKHSVEHHSRYTGFIYPWSHMTSVEGADIIPGGMEFPMMTVMGSYQGRGARALYNVTSHEIAHMWIPMVVATNERRYAWMDEGATSFLENQGRPDFNPGDRAHEAERENYLGMARADMEQPMMLHGDFYAPGPGYTVASYWKPAALLVTLRGLLGTELFEEAYRGFIADWAWGHPTPWDFFNAFERAAGRDLDWFWTSWFYETWTLDHAIASVEAGGREGTHVTAEGPGSAEQGTVVTVADRGWAFLPARLRLTTTDGASFDAEVPVDRWLSGATEARVYFPVDPSEVESVELDPENVFPDVDPSNDSSTAF